MVLFGLDEIQYLICIGLLLSTCSVLVVKAFPSLNVLLQYGKTAATETERSSPSSVVQALVRLTVPKSWFLHFYVVYFTYLLAGALYIGHHNIVYVLLLAQAFRRLGESLFITKFSPTSKINVAHYVAGMMFYVTISTNTLILLYQQGDVTAQGPSRYSGILVSVFIIASVDQFSNHYYLSKLIKYTTPTRGLFQVLATPHYFDEIVIYFVIALLSSHSFKNNNNGNSKITIINYWLSFTFVLTNLTISSLESYKYYKDKNHTYKWAIIPGII